MTLKDYGHRFNFLQQCVADEKLKDKQRIRRLLCATLSKSRKKLLHSARVGVRLQLLAHCGGPASLSNSTAKRCVIKLNVTVIISILNTMYDT